MKAKRVNRDEQLKLIMECRSSGLSDYQWCEAHGILPGTFYNWITRLRKAGITIPASGISHQAAPVSQEVVKIDLVGTPLSSAAIMEQNTNIQAIPVTNTGVAMEIVMGNSIIRFFNTTNPELIRTTLQCLGGMSHAW